MSNLEIYILEIYILEIYILEIYILEIYIMDGGVRGRPRRQSVTAAQSVRRFAATKYR